MSETESKYQLWVGYIDGVRPQSYIMLRESRKGAMQACERQLEHHGVEVGEWTTLAYTGGEGRAMRPEDGVIVDVMKKWVREEGVDG
jgi:hypothetical protein